MVQGLRCDYCKFSYETASYTHSVENVEVMLKFEFASFSWGFAFAKLMESIEETIAIVSAFTIALPYFGYYVA